MLEQVATDLRYRAVGREAGEAAFNDYIAELKVLILTLNCRLA